MGTERVFPPFSVQKQSQEESDWFAHLCLATGSCSGRSCGVLLTTAVKERGGFLCAASGE